MREKPDIVYGRLLESAHLTGYSLNRVFSEFEWLLDDGRWKQVGDGFEDINDFLRSVSLPSGIDTDRRKTLARKLTAELAASQRATAKALGVDESTVREDLGKRRAGNPAPKAIEPAPESQSESVPAGDPAPAWFADRAVDPAKLAKGRAERKQRDVEAEAKRIEKLREANAEIDVPAPDIRHGDFREVLADLEGVDAIITDPPYGKEALPLLADLAEWAARALGEEGILAVLFGQAHLPQVYELLGGHVPYRWTACLLTPGPGYVSHAARVQSGWKPVLIYGGGPRFSDVVQSEGLDAAAKDRHYWGQDLIAFATLVERLTLPGQLVCDPFMGGGTTALACQALGRRFVGCDVDESAVITARGRLRDAA